MDDGNAGEPDLYRAGRRDGRGVAKAAGLIADQRRGLKQLTPSTWPLPVGMPNFAARSSRSALLNSRSRRSASASSFCTARRKRSRPVAAECSVIYASPLLSRAHLSRQPEAGKGTPPQRFRPLKVANLGHTLCYQPPMRTALSLSRRAFIYLLPSSWTRNSSPPRMR